MDGRNPAIGYTPICASKDQAIPITFQPTIPTTFEATIPANVPDVHLDMLTQVLDVLKDETIVCADVT